VPDNETTRGRAKAYAVAIRAVVEQRGLKHLLVRHGGARARTHVRDEAYEEHRDSHGADQNARHGHLKAARETKRASRG
jgi:hypothetical protein